MSRLPFAVNFKSSKLESVTALILVYLDIIILTKNIKTKNSRYFGISLMIIYGIW